MAHARKTTPPKPAPAKVAEQHAAVVRHESRGDRKARIRRVFEEVRRDHRPLLNLLAK
ncbi:MAG TPA: hypothetical protein VI072_21755 [Polyangiaceae bacterium]